RSVRWPQVQSNGTRCEAPPRSRSLHVWRRAWENPTALSPLYKNCSRSRTRVRSQAICRLLQRCSAWIQCLIRSGMIRGSKSSLLRPDRSDPTPICSFANPACSRAIAPSRLQIAQPAIVNIQIVSRSHATPNSLIIALPLAVRFVVSVPLGVRFVVSVPLGVRLVFVVSLLLEGDVV